ncbi:sushi domain-containing protein [Nephila pilipes]|uniref:Sushi domain-containing protein n=1 Tax=Nephila pilipes TaxID=299642 RepID=A0A8X6U1R6_NEPPI|nr:sushi domain-containing protein [Nephila pilipes]
MFYHFSVFLFITIAATAIEVASSKTDENKTQIVISNWNNVAPSKINSYVNAWKKHVEQLDNVQSNLPRTPSLSEDRSYIGTDRTTKTYCFNKGSERVCMQGNETRGNLNETEKQDYKRYNSLDQIYKYLNREKKNLGISKKRGEVFLGKRGEYTPPTTDVKYWQYKIPSKSENRKMKRRSIREFSNSKNLNVKHDAVVLKSILHISKGNAADVEAEYGTIVTGKENSKPYKTFSDDKATFGIEGERLNNTEDLNKERSSAKIAKNASGQRERQSDTKIDKIYKKLQFKSRQKRFADFEGKGQNKDKNDIEEDDDDEEDDDEEDDDEEDDDEEDDDEEEDDEEDDDEEDNDEEDDDDETDDNENEATDKNDGGKDKDKDDGSKGKDKDDGGKGKDKDDKGTVLNLKKSGNKSIRGGKHRGPKIIDVDDAYFGENETGEDSENYSDYSDVDDTGDYADKAMRSDRKYGRHGRYDYSDDDFGSYEDRLLQNRKSCKLPPPRNTSEILCKMSTKGASCLLFCIHGYTFPEGIVRKTRCDLIEGNWTKPFDECSPFVDCSLRLKTVGYMKCTTNKFNKGPECSIKCERYKDKLKVPKRTYKCDVKGKWTPKLPHCVKSENIETVPPPRKREHTKIIDYP